MSIRNLFTGLLLLLASSLSLFAQSNDRLFVSAKYENNVLCINVSDGLIRLTPYSQYSIEVSFRAHADEELFPSHAIAPENHPVKATYTETEQTIKLSTGQLSALINKAPFSISYYYNEELILGEEAGYFADSVKQGFRFKLMPDELLMGGGERALGMNRRGNKLQLYNRASYGYQTHADLMYYSMPLLISSNKYMLGFDNGASGWLDIGKTETDILQFDAAGGRMSYFVVASDSWLDLNYNFTQLTGHQPMLPRWALGNISSRMGYHSQQEVETVIDLYQKDDIPLDGIVLDLYWFGPDVTGHMGNLEWYRDSFPEPEKMLERNKSKGINTVLITEPFILKNSGKYKECAEQQLLGTDSLGNPYIFDFFFGTTALLDIFKPEAQHWFWEIYKKHTMSGVDGWWGDLGEPEVHPDDLMHVNGRADEVHNLYGHEWAKTISKGYQQDFPDNRPVILMRAGFIGSQRYGLVPWSGDVSRSWGGLQSQVEIALQMGMQGLAYIHSDLGGFAGDYRDAELYTRWLQYGVFQPIYRTHAQEDVPPEPVFWDDNTKAVVRDFIRLRYQLTPYLYTLMYENTVKGWPLMRPLFYLEDNAELYNETKTYLWGDNFLVSPVVEKGLKSQSVYLPRGHNWFNFFTDEKFEGGQTVNVVTDISTLPVFVKAGSFIPMVPVYNNMTAYTSEHLILHYYHDPSIKTSTGQMYEDDGVTRDSYKSNKYELLNFDASHQGSLQLTIKPEGYDYEGKPDSRHIELIIHNYSHKPKNININGKKVKITKSSSKPGTLKAGAYYNLQTKQLHINSEMSNEALKVLID
ncbi:DUF5110 domain-containing protein [Carboxylicivirga sediminis]|uniref:DUF5110 domain-containing protein n=1 Tax=Carboxylicivirga sediminis TaxID=2006564 RepID=A0A941F376_9BACT|nr:TIM-barrel domain-containing protein [Carboxylicivirga sediminis]MBR8534925.1 DUF5110 domain-containing protein [Carboxylicivirga sediminis]